MEQNKKAKDGEKSFCKLFNLIRYIAKSGDGISGKQLVVESGIPASTTFRMLKFLVDGGYIAVHNGLYTLGIEMARLGDIARDQNPLAKTARPFLEQLSEQSLETAHLARRERNQVLYVDKVDGVRPIRMVSMVGTYSPLYCTGVGKAMLAFMPSREREALLEEMKFERLTPTTITDTETLRSELVKIAQQGYAVDNCEQKPGLYCIAAPVFDNEGKLIAGISISGAEFYMRTDTQKLASLVMQTANALSQALGHRV
ncbi:MAG: IclR family transcriptional regulator [Victivallales bacterium]|nr:IclR family transcriptional regulator [Victivallales bacterium]